MKKAIAIALVLVLITVGAFVLYSHRDTSYIGIGELTEKARDVIPISDAENIDISYAGKIEKDGQALVWFVSGNKNQSHYYLPMECSMVAENEYKYECTYKPRMYSSDIAVMQWKDGYAFVINNSDCVSLRIETENKSLEKVIESCPYVFYYKGSLSKYTFLDCNGNEM